MLALLLALQSVLGNPDYKQGVELFQKGQLDASIPFLLRAANTNPRDARAWKALGVVYAAQGAYDLAKEPFQRACDLDPKLEDACYYCGRTLYALNLFEPSLAVLTRTAAGDSKSWKIHLGIAQALEALQRPREAEKEFKESLSQSRNTDPKPGVAYGLFLVRQGRFEEAVAPLEETLKRFPESAEAHIHLGRALMERDKLSEAILHFERAVAIDPTSAQAHLLLAKAYVRTGRIAESQPHFEAAVRYGEGSRTVK
jgi:tetratricopeptide (TPR) repeat protein